LHFSVPSLYTSVAALCQNLADIGGAIKNFTPVVLSSTTTKSHATAIATDFIEAASTKISHLLCGYIREITCSGNGITWITIISNTQDTYPCILALGNNTSAIGWLHKANIDASNNYPLHQAARKYAEVLMKGKCCLYSQHIRGVHNNAANALSRFYSYSPEELTQFILNHCPSQVPPTFHIKPLPPEIYSWTISWLQKIKDPVELERELEGKKKESGHDGVSTAGSSKTHMTHSSKNCNHNYEPGFSAPLQPLCIDDSFQSQTRSLWEQAQGRRPWQNWVRSLGRTWGTTPPMATQQEASTHASPDNSEV